MCLPVHGQLEQYPVLNYITHRHWTLNEGIIEYVVTDFLL